MKHLRPTCNCGSKMKLHTRGNVDPSTFTEDVKRNRSVKIRNRTNDRIRHTKQPAPSKYHLTFKCTHMLCGVTAVFEGRSHREVATKTRHKYHRIIRQGHVLNTLARIERRRQA